LDQVIGEGFLGLEYFKFISPWSVFFKASFLSN
jgi:hypothetical protein